MKQKFIVYYHHTILDHAIIKAYSKAEAQYIMEQRMAKSGLFEAAVDKVLSEAAEQKIIDNKN